MAKAPGIGTTTSRIWFHGGCRWRAYIMSKARCIGQRGSTRKNHGAILRLRTGLASAAGNELERFDQPCRQVSLSPPAFVSGKFLYPYADRGRRVRGLEMITERI